MNVLNIKAYKINEDMVDGGVDLSFDVLSSSVKTKQLVIFELGTVRHQRASNNLLNYSTRWKGRYGRLEFLIPADWFRSPVILRTLLFSFFRCLVRSTSLLRVGQRFSFTVLVVPLRTPPWSPGGENPRSKFVTCGYCCRSFGVPRILTL